MILSKANLMAVTIASDDKTVPMLNNLRIESDGTTIAANGRCVLVVSPVPEEVRKGLGYMEDSGPVGDVTIAADTVKEVLRNMPKDTKFGGLLEYTDMAQGPKGITFRLRDGMRDRSIGAKVYARNYFDYRQPFAKASEEGARVRIVLNRKRLISLLTALDKICPDTSGESPVFMEIAMGDDIILKAEGNNGQRVLGFMKTYQGGEGDWMLDNDWEKGILYPRKPIEKRRPLRKVPGNGP